MRQDFACYSGNLNNLVALSSSIMVERNKKDGVACGCLGKWAAVADDTRNGGWRVTRDNGTEPLRLVQARCDGSACGILLCTR